MSCSCSKFDIDEGFKCSITGDRCVFMFPNAKACYELYGEGPYKCEKAKNIGIDLASGKDKTGMVKR
ncbi:hypothetical protein ACV3RY_14955 [Clostridium perfringens]